MASTTVARSLCEQMHIPVLCPYVHMSVIMSMAHSFLLGYPDPVGWAAQVTCTIIMPHPCGSEGTCDWELCWQSVLSFCERIVHGEG